MIVDRINYKKVFPISSFCTEHIGLEATLDENENPEEALNKLKVMVDTLHAETLTQLESYRGSSVRTVEQEPKIDILQGALDEIEKCTTIDELKGLWLISKSNLTLSAAYKVKEKQLTNAK